MNAARYLILMGLLLPELLQAQMANAADSPFRVRASAVAGLTATNYSTPPTPQSTQTTYLGNALCARIVWHPNHMLAAGVQSGFLFFSADDVVIDGIESGKAGLAAVPIQMIITMSSRKFEFGIGLGTYYLQSIWRIRGIQRAASTDFEYGINPWIGYEFTIADRFTLGPELGAHILSNRGLSSLQLGLRCTADVIRY